MSTLDQAAVGSAPPAWAPANVLADRFLHVALFVTLASSFYVIIQPAPYEYLAAVLAFTCVLARVALPRVVLPFLILILLRDAGGALGLLKILSTGWMRIEGDPTATEITVDYPDSIRFLATSFYLGLSGVMIACIVSQDTLRRIATIRAGYVTAAVLATALGTAQYFKLIPGLTDFVFDGRVSGGFKGPNDLGSFVIAPMMWLISGFIVGNWQVRNILACLVIFVGLAMTFSRGAWGTSLLSASMMIYLLYLTQTDPRSRNRLVVFVVAAVIAAVAVFLLLSSIDGVRQMFVERSQFQSYDINADNRSRLNLEEDSLREMFDHPLGMGPWGFAHTTNWVSHDVYLGAMLNHGWVGGIAYLTLVVLTLVVGFHSIWRRTPWQPYMIATYVSFIAMALEGLWGDTDHWRHFYILMGLIWGLAAATRKASRTLEPLAVGNTPLSRDVRTLPVGPELLR